MKPKRFRTEEEWLAHETGDPGELRAAKWMYAMLAAVIVVAAGVLIWRVVG